MLRKNVKMLRKNIKCWGNVKCWEIECFKMVSLIKNVKWNVEKKRKMLRKNVKCWEKNVKCWKIELFWKNKYWKKNVKMLKNWMFWKIELFWKPLFLNLKKNCILIVLKKNIKIWETKH